jgi:hypothetical protein
MSNWTAGLPEAKEYATQDAPTEPFWCENLLFAGYDPAVQIGFWLHLGTVPNDWTMWEDRVLMTLPGDSGVLSMWAYHRTVAERRPAGSNLAMVCDEPFRRWTVTFDGFAQHIPTATMAAGLAPDSLRKKVRIELHVSCVTPVWDAQASAKGARGKGDMAHQSWAKEHYEQLWRATGTVEIDGVVHPWNGCGWRDHSRGPRGGNTADPWGGHFIVGVLMPSGRGAIMSSYWRPDGIINLEGAQVTDADGTTHSAAVTSIPRLSRDLMLAGEMVTPALSWDGGSAAITLRTDQSIWTSMQKRLAVGRDLEGPGLMYVLNFGTAEWDGETGVFYIERSDPLNNPPGEIRAG